MVLLLLTLAGCGPELVALPCDPDDVGAGESALVFTGERPTNLLMISLDTFRRDRVGRYGGSPGGDLDTDFLDGLLSEGVALDDHRSCSNWTYPAMLCALTGQGPTELGFIPTTNTGEAPPLIPESIEFLGDWMGEAGYSTQLITANKLIGEKFGFSRAYNQHIEHSDADAGTINSYAAGAIYELREATQPWFLHLHYIDPHITYQPPEEYLGELASLTPLDMEVNHKSGLKDVYNNLEDYSAEELALIQEHLRVYYNGEMAYLDDQLEEVFKDLEAQGLLEDTLVVLYSDHGEQFFEHGGILHHEDLYQEESDAVALFWSPGLSPGSWTAPTRHADLVPTILDALGLPIPDQVRGQIVGSQPEVCARFAHALDEESGTQSVDHGALRMVYDWDGTVRLFDRIQDPAEQRDLVDQRPEDALLLWSFLAPQVELLEDLHPSARAKAPRL